MKYAYLNLLMIFFVNNTSFAQQKKFVLPFSGEIVKSSKQFELLDLTGDSLVLGYLTLKEGGNERQAIVTPIAKEDWLNSITTYKTAESFAGFANPVLYV